MPALPPVANTLKLTVEGTTPQYPWVNVFHWGYTGVAPSAADCADFADTLYVAWVAHINPLMDTNASSEKATCIDLASTLGSSGESATHEPGARGTAELPGSTCVLVSKHVGRRYRGGHPRSYLNVGISSDLADESHWAGLFTAGVTTAYAALSTAMLGHTSGSTTLDGEVTVSYVDKAVNPVAPFRRPTPLVLPVLAATAQTQIAVQRRRIGR